MRSVPCLLLCLLVLCIVTSCGPKPAEQTNQPTDSSAAASQGEADIPQDSGVATDEELIARGGAADRSMRVAFSFEQQFPNLHTLLADNTGLYSEIAQYAEQVVTGQSIAKEEDILAVMSQRDENLIPKLNPLFETIDEDVFYENIEAYEGELEQIGLSVATVEGMFGTLTGHEMLKDKVAEIGSDPLKLYLEFLQADANSIGGEYPYSNMEPYADMILIGEDLFSQFPDSKYAEMIKPRFDQSLCVFVGLYQVTDGKYPTYRIGDPMNQDYYTLSEGETLNAFESGHADSKYHGVIKEKLASISNLSPKPENLYLLHFGQAEDEEAAIAQQVNLLNEGLAASHIVRVKMGDGKTHFLIVHSFFEDSNQASDLFDKLEPKHENLQLMMCSVHKGELNQLGI